jgi:hypothetical protein
VWVLLFAERLVRRVKENDHGLRLAEEKSCDTL